MKNEKRFHGRSSCSMRLGKTAGQTSEWGSETAFKAKEITHELHPYSFGNRRRLVYTPEVRPAETWNIHLTAKFLSGDKQP